MAAEIRGGSARKPGEIGGISLVKKTTSETFVSGVVFIVFIVLDNF